MLNYNYDNIPQELKDLKQWVCYRDKAPLSPLYNGNASPTNPDHWGTFEQAVRAVEKYNYNGIGFVFTDTTPYCGIDIDHCINPDTGEINNDALDIVQTVDSYTELSPSGTGIHIIYKGENHPTDWKKKKTDALCEGVDLEMYQEQRYFRVTGNQYGDYSAVCDSENMAQLVYDTYFNKSEDKPVVTPTPSSPCKPVIPLSDCDDSQSLSDDKIVELASRSKNGDKFKKLYFDGNKSEYGDDDSRADSGLCSILAFYTKDTAQIDRIFRKSGLMREKWDRPTAGSTYGKITIENALNLVTASYDTDYKKTPPIAHLKKPDNSKTAENVKIPEKYDRYNFNIEIPELSFDTIRCWKQQEYFTAEKFAECIKGYVKYIPELKDFYIYNGAVWVEDKGRCLIMGAVKQFLKNCIACIPEDTKIEDVAKKRLIEQGVSEEELKGLSEKALTSRAGITDDEEKRINDENKFLQQLRAYYNQQLTLYCRKNIVDDIASILHINFEKFDDKPLLFNVRNCTINLETLDVQNQNAEDLLTKIADVDYNPTAVSPVWDKFIDTTFCGNEEDKKFIQKSLGYCLSGIKDAECVFVCYGPTTRNGKGVLFNTILGVFGDYGKPMAFSTVASSKNSKNGSSPSPDLIELKGSRLVSASEPDKGAYFDAGLLKQLTGRDYITARQIYGKQVKFLPEFSIFISCNNRPNVSDNSVFQSGRIKEIKFDKHFSDDEQDKDLKNKLLDENTKSAILNWLIEGYKLYKAEGLKPTAKMAESVKQYEADNDIIQIYINERLEPLETQLSKNKCDKAVWIRKDYIDWCKMLGCSPIGRATFKEELTKHGIQFDVSHKQDIIINYRLKTDDPTDCLKHDKMENEIYPFKSA
ncbi:MAG: phage/plasmid primase, P4 family [Clostridia bacterium]|nr:phage/plasmid primase, P4 family [Clostridia bacterium]